MSSAPGHFPGMPEEDKTPIVPRVPMSVGTRVRRATERFSAAALDAAFLAIGVQRQVQSKISPPAPAVPVSSPSRINEERAREERETRWFQRGVDNEEAIATLQENHDMDANRRDIQARRTMRWVVASVSALGIVGVAQYSHRTASAREETLEMAGFASNTEPHREEKAPPDNHQNPSAPVSPAEKSFDRSQTLAVMRQLNWENDLTPEQVAVARKKAEALLVDPVLRSKVVGATVIIENDAGRSSGVVLDARTMIASKHSMIKNGSISRLRQLFAGPRMKHRLAWTPDTSRYVVADDPASDLVVIVFHRDVFDPKTAVEIADGSLHKGQVLVACGSREASTRVPVAGWIAGTQDEPGKGELLRVDSIAPFGKGMSGGPLLNEEGKLVGFHSMRLISVDGSLTQFIDSNIMSHLIASAKERARTMPLAQNSRVSPRVIPPRAVKPPPSSSLIHPESRTFHNRSKGGGSGRSLGGDIERIGAGTPRGFGDRSETETRIAPPVRQEIRPRPIIIDFDDARRK